MPLRHRYKATTVGRGWARAADYWSAKVNLTGVRGSLPAPDATVADQRFASVPAATVLKKALFRHF